MVSTRGVVTTSFRSVRMLVAFVASVLLSTASACGGEGGDGTRGATPVQWSGDVCSAMSGWIKGMRAEAAAVQDGEPDTIPEQRENIVDFLDSAVAGADQMLSEVDEAGFPDVQDGEAIAQDYYDQFAAAREGLVQARTKADALSDDPEQYEQAVAELAVAMKAAFAASRAGFGAPLAEKYDVSELRELEQAFATAPECQGEP
jgi:hypothetical protein